MPNSVQDPTIRDSFCLNSIIKEAKADATAKGCGSIMASFNAERVHKASFSSFSRAK